VRSQIRGLRVLTFAVPLLIMALIASSQVSRLPVRQLWKQEKARQPSLKGRFELTRSSAQDVPVQLEWRVYFGRRQRPQPAPRLAMRYQVWDAQQNIHRRQMVPLKLSPNQLAARQATFRSRPIPLSGGAPYWFQAQLGRPNDQSLQLRGWDLYVIQDPESPSNRWLRMAEVFVYPLLAISLLGLVMVLGPRLIR
jgi:hypothetical protein